MKKLFLIYVVIIASCTQSEEAAPYRFMPGAEDAVSDSIVKSRKLTDSIKRTQIKFTHKKDIRRSKFLAHKDSALQKFYPNTYFIKNYLKEKSIKNFMLENPNWNKVIADIRKGDRAYQMIMDKDLKAITFGNTQLLILNKQHGTKSLLSESGIVFMAYINNYVGLN
jgi:hypothetical protein